MALVSAYSNNPRKEVYDTIIVAHFDGHGVATAAARLLLLQKQGQRVEVYSKFPDTGPTPRFPAFVDELRRSVEAKVAEVIDIPVNVRSPDLHIDAEARLPATQIFHYDHHETSVPFAGRLAAKGVIPVITSNAVQMAAALGLLADEDSKKLAIIGIVCDRDASVLSLVPRSEVERVWLPLANKLDVIVRNPSIVNEVDQAGVAKKLAFEKLLLLETAAVEYPPARLATEWEARIEREGSLAILIDYPDMPMEQSMWAPKTLEQLLLRHGKDFAVAVLPAVNPRTRQMVGYDVRILKYWLSQYPATVEEIVKDMIAEKVITGSVVGHADYVSMRYGNLEEARATARIIYRRIEGLQPTTAHLVSDSVVAEAVRSDFQKILEKLSEILEEQKKMYQQYLKLKEEQVRLLRETQRHEYD